MLEIFFVVNGTVAWQWKATANIATAHNVRMVTWLGELRRAAAWTRDAEVMIERTSSDSLRVRTCAYCNSFR